MGGGAPAVALPGGDAWLAARACGLNVTVALGAGGVAVGAGAAAAGEAGGGTTALAADDEAADDGRLTLRLGVIMRAVLPRVAIRARRV
jgi:hypothetical protein